MAMALKLKPKARPEKGPQVQSNVTVLLTIFFDCNGEEDNEFLPQCCSVNKEYYLEVMPG